MKSTIEFLYRGEPSNVCRFPARYFWLRQQLAAPELPLEACKDIVEFREKAPMDEISLAFASESIAQPASMLGHAFIKFSGKNASGHDASYSISFCTDADTFNLPKLLFDSLVIGKKGHFSLAPYHDMQQRYVDSEQRNLWEFQLELDESQKELIRLHLLELKQSRQTYYFQKYNCATVINFIVALAGRPLPENGWWVTPKGVVKNASQAGLVREIRVTSANYWLVRALAKQITVLDQKAIREQVQQGDAASHVNPGGDEAAYLHMEMALAYNQYAYETGVIKEDIWTANDHGLRSVKSQYFPNMSLTTEDQFNPVNSPGENQVSIGATDTAGKGSASLTILPVSHTLNDDNRSYGSENSLQLFATTLKIPVQGGTPTMDKLTIYDVESLMPHDLLTGGLSGHFHLALEPQKNAALEDTHVFVVSGGLGLTRRIVPDIDIYALGGGGAGDTGKHGYLYSTAEVGAILREVWDMKSWIALTRTDHQIDAASHYYSVELSQSKYINKSYTINLDILRDFNGRHERNSLAIALKRIF